VAKLVCLVHQGAEAFLADKNAQLSWGSDLEELRPREIPRSEAELIRSLRRYAETTGRRSWQASFLLGCSLLRDQYLRGRNRIVNERAYKALARYVLTLIDSLFDIIGAAAFKVVPAMSGKRNPSSLVRTKSNSTASYASRSHFWNTGQLSTDKCKALGRRVAEDLLIHSDKRWQEIGFEYTLDPSEYLRLVCKT
jgi:hypothetical protein